MNVYNMDGQTFCIISHFSQSIEYGNHVSGASASKIGQLLGISKGMVYGYLNRAIVAVLNLKGDTVFWPNVEERQVW